jgi:hypothetical protein
MTVDAKSEKRRSETDCLTLGEWLLVRAVPLSKNKANGNETK